MDIMTQGQFYEQVIRKLGSDMCLIKYHLFQNKVDTSYFTLHSIRNDMPKSLESTNKDILSFILG